MLMDFLATAAAGAGIAGLIFVIRHMSGGRLPRWLLPAGVGLAMLIFSIWNEYSWYGRVTAELPPEVIVVSAPVDRVFYRPWTYVAPMTSRFVALDRGGMLLSPTNPDLRMASALIVQRWATTQNLPLAFDCAKRQSAVLVEGAEVADDGALVGASWQEVGPEDALWGAACKGG